MTSAIQPNPLDVVAAIGRRAVTLSALARIMDSDPRAVEQAVYEAIKQGWVVTLTPRLPATAGYGAPETWQGYEREPGLVVTDEGLEAGSALEGS